MRLLSRISLASPLPGKARLQAGFESCRGRTKAHSDARTEASTKVCIDKSPSFAKFCEENLLEVEEGLTELIEGSACCISSVSEPGEPIVWVSDEFLEMVGFQREEVLGHTWNLLQGERTTPESISEVRRIISSRTTGFVCLTSYTKQDVEFDSTFYLRPLNRAGQCRFYLCRQTDSCPPLCPSSPMSRQASPNADTCQDACKGATTADGVQAPESNVEIRISGGQTGLANQGPLSFDNDWVQGSVAVGTRVDPLDPRSADLFEGPSKHRRGCAMLLDIKFKQVPEGAQWYCAGEIDGEVTLNFGSRLVSQFILSAIKLWDKTMGYSLGSKSSTGFIYFSLDRWFETDGPIVAGKKYNWETGCNFIDPEGWQVINFPEGRTIQFTPYWGSRPLRMVIFAKQGKSPEWIRALELELNWKGHDCGPSRGG